MNEIELERTDQRKQRDKNIAKKRTDNLSETGRKDSTNKESDGTGTANAEKHDEEEWNVKTRPVELEWRVAGRAEKHMRA